MQAVYLTATFIVLLAFVVMFFLPEVTLRSGSAYDQRAADEKAAGDEPAGEPARDPQDAPRELVSVAAQDGHGGATATSSFEPGASNGFAYDPAKRNGSGPDGLPTAEDFAVPRTGAKGRHRMSRGEITA